MWKSAEKGKGNIQNGNRYLSWAFAEAAEHARRFDTASRNFYNRKVRERNSAVAHSALAHKLARAASYSMRDQSRTRRQNCSGKDPKGTANQSRGWDDPVTIEWSSRPEPGCGKCFTVRCPCREPDRGGKKP
jgi:hypothetical protein